ALAFTAALHTYLRVGDIAGVSLTGLAGSGVLTTDSGKAGSVSTAELTIAGTIDNIYTSVERELLLTDGHHAIGIAQSGFPDAVVWNPWPDGSRALADLPDDGYRHMLCVEAAAIAMPVEV